MSFGFASIGQDDPFICDFFQNLLYVTKCIYNRQAPDSSKCALKGKKKIMVAYYNPAVFINVLLQVMNKIIFHSAKKQSSNINPIITGKICKVKIFFIRKLF